MLHFDPGDTQPSSDPNAPIALFDSGVGGLGVLSALHRRAPDEPLLYIADQAHVPYGGRPLPEIRSFATGLTGFCFSAGAKLVVMACNVSSATYGDEAAARYGDRVLGVVEPGARAAVQASRRGRIGVLATAGTVATEAYPVAVERLEPAAQVTQVACPRFVPLVEAGAFDGPDTETAVREALAPLAAAEVDTVVLGCTHYPYLLPVLARLAPHLTFVDPAEATADEALLRLGGLRASGPAHHRLCTTGDPDRFAAQAAALLGPLSAPIEALAWTVRAA